jgi:circadian clock protein KaiC
MRKAHGKRAVKVAYGLLASAAAGTVTKVGQLPKAPTGIRGLDEITMGGLPRGRPTLVCGPAGSGKTLLAMEFLVRGALEYAEPGVFVAFEETAADLAANVASLGFDLEALQKSNLLAVEEILVDTDQIIETGPFDLEGLFLRIGAAVDSVKAKRVVVDTLEVLFGGIANHGIIRAELNRLFKWFKDRGLTVIVTGEQGERLMTRHGLEEYVADCVLVLDHRISDQLSTRRLRIAKYRGSLHGTNEYPFLIGSKGMSVLPITSLELQHSVSSSRITSGIDRLDHMLGGGVYRGSSVMITGSAGTGKTTFAATYADAACRRGERALFVSFEESQPQVIRNMKSAGLKLGEHVDSGHLRFFASRPSEYGLEMHLISIHQIVDEFKPSLVVIDRISDFGSLGTFNEIRATFTRLIDYLKRLEITAVLTERRSSADETEYREVGVDAMMDSWISLTFMDSGGERNRCVSVVKARGTANSNQMREYRITNEGVEIIDAYLGLGEVLTGTARIAQEARERDLASAVAITAQRRRTELELKEHLTAVQVETLDAERSAINLELVGLAQRSEQTRTLAAGDLSGMSRLRKVDLDSGTHPNNGARTTGKRG